MQRHKKTDFICLCAYIHTNKSVHMYILHVRHILNDLPGSNQKALDVRLKPTMGFAGPGRLKVSRYEPKPLINDYTTEDSLSTLYQCIEQTIGTRNSS